MEKDRKQLWELLTVFPSYEVRWYGFRFLGGADELKAAAYAQTEDSNLRSSILVNTSAADRQTLKLGANDEDQFCRGLAYEKYSDLGNQGRAWQVVGHVWTALVDAAILLVIVLLFSRVETTFERLVVSLLVYVHLELTSSFAGFTRMYQTAMSALDVEFRRLRTLGGEKLSGEQLEADTEQQAEFKRGLAKANVRLYIHAVFQLLMWIVVVYQLATTIL